MSDISTSGPDIKIVSWPPMWVYWPAYLALAKTENDIPGTRFELSAPEGDPTDESIRKDFFEVIKSEAAFALCEPGEMEQSDEQADDPRVIRRLPVLWRQPHWVFWKRRETDEISQSDIWAFPTNTTSGDFVREVSKQLSVFERYRGSIKQAPTEPGEERAHLLDMAQSDCLVSFTPWHAILSFNADNALAGTGTTLFEHEVLSGPMRDVTAIQIPDREPDVDHVATQLEINLKSVLTHLSTTQGDYGKVRELIEHSGNMELVRELLGRNGDEPMWLQSSFLVPALSEYVKLGCYFPYRTLDSAISAEIQKRVGEVLRKLHDQALIEVKAEMSKFLGKSLDFETSTMEERLSVWRTANPSGGIPLWKSLHHHGENCDTPIREILQPISAQTHVDQPPFPISSFTQKLHSRCLRMGEKYSDAYASCLKRDHLEGTVQAHEGEDALKHICALCVLAGTPTALLRPTAGYLAKEFKAPVSYELASTEKGKTGILPCPLFFEDVRPIVELFVREQRPFESEIPIRVVCYNGYAASGGTQPGSIIFGVWWDGSTEPRNESGNTHDELRRWKQEHIGDRLNVSWVGTWKKSANPPIEIKKADGNLASNDDIERSLLWKRAYLEFERSQYVFAYLTVLDIPSSKTGEGT